MRYTLVLSVVPIHDVARPVKVRLLAIAATRLNLVRFAENFHSLSNVWCDDFISWFGVSDRFLVFRKSVVS